MNSKEEIPLHQMGDLEIRDDNRLYWKGKPVATEERIKLGVWVNLAIILGGISTAVLAFIEIVQSLSTVPK